LAFPHPVKPVPTKPYNLVPRQQDAWWTTRSACREHWQSADLSGQWSDTIRHATRPDGRSIPKSSNDHVNISIHRSHRLCLLYPCYKTAPVPTETIANPSPCLLGTSGSLATAGHQSVGTTIALVIDDDLASYKLASCKPSSTPSGVHLRCHSVTSDRDGFLRRQACNHIVGKPHRT
jgi:hypothetical protein